MSEEKKPEEETKTEESVKEEPAAESESTKEEPKEDVKETEAEPEKEEEDIIKTDASDDNGLCSDLDKLCGGSTAQEIDGFVDIEK